MLVNKLTQIPAHACKIIQGHKGFVVHNCPAIMYCLKPTFTSKYHQSPISNNLLTHTSLLPSTTRLTCYL